MRSNKDLPVALSTTGAKKRGVFRNVDVLPRAANEPPMKTNLTFVPTIVVVDVLHVYYHVTV